MSEIVKNILTKGVFFQICEYVEDPSLDLQDGEGKYPYFGPSADIILCGKVTDVGRVRSLVPRSGEAVGDSTVLLHSLAVMRRNAKMSLQQRFDHFWGRYSNWLKEYLEMKGGEADGLSEGSQAEDM